MILRQHILSHPATFVALWLVGWWTATKVWPSVRVAEVSDELSRVVGILVTVTYVLLVGWYVALGTYVDHVEPSVVAVSWIATQGQPMYPAPASGDMYGLPYGPFLFGIHAAAMLLLGPSILSSKLPAALCAVGSLLVLAVAVRCTERSGTWRAISVAGVLSLTFGVASFWVRAEPVLLLCVSLCLLSTSMRHRPAAILAGVTWGIAMGLKISAAIYFVPALLLLWQRHGRQTVFQAAAISVGTTLAPFVLLQQLSLPDYLYWLRSLAGHGIRWSSIPKMIEWASCLVLVTWFITRAAGTRAADGGMRERAVTSLRWSISVLTMASVPIAAKYGTGVYHFLPFVPSVAFLVGIDRRKLSPYAPAALFAAIVIATLQLSPALIAARRQPSTAITEELRDLAGNRRATMGYSPNYRLSFYRPILVFAGGLNVLDGASAMDWQWSGRPFPATSVDMLRSCEVERWILPVGPSFTLRNEYPTGMDVFPDVYRRVFAESYHLVRRGQFFDVWDCRDPPRPQPAQE